MFDAIKSLLSKFWQWVQLNVLRNENIWKYSAFFVGGGVAGIFVSLNYHKKIADLTGLQLTGKNETFDNNNIIKDNEVQYNSSPREESKVNTSVWCPLTNLEQTKEIISFFEDVEPENASFGKNIWLSKDAFDCRDELIELRNHFHANAELSWKEFETTKFIENYLNKLNETYDLNPKLSFQNRSKFGETGLMCKLQGSGCKDNDDKKDNSNNERKGKCIGLRADIDALPIDESKSTFEHKSKNENVSHMCGHDAHISVLLITIKLFCKYQKYIDSKDSILFIFQCSEETGGGAYSMINDKNFENNNNSDNMFSTIDEIYGLHVGSRDAFGSISLNCDPNALMSGCCNFKIMVEGNGGHGALPHLTNDTMIAACNLILQSQTIVSRNADPNKFAVLSFGKLECGNKANVIANDAIIEGTMRWFDAQIGKLLKTRLMEVCAGIENTYNVKVKFTTPYRDYPSLINNKMAYNNVVNAAAKVFNIGKNEKCKLLNDNCEKNAASEDFAEYLLCKPGAFFFLGSKFNEANDKTKQYFHHSPEFKINPKAMVIGVQMFINIVFHSLG